MHLRDLLIPRINGEYLPLLIGNAALASLLFGLYGALHNQVSISICPEYFTDFKFDQFAWVDMGLPDRVFAGLIGFLASWWGGAIGIWFLGRYRIQRLPKTGIQKDLRHSFAIVMLSSLFGSALGLFYGQIQVWTGQMEGWNQWRFLGIEDLEAFAKVGWMHNGSYLGAVLGVVAAFVLLSRRTSPTLPPDSGRQTSPPAAHP